MRPAYSISSVPPGTLIPEDIFRFWFERMLPDPHFRPTEEMIRSRAIRDPLDIVSTIYAARPLDTQINMRPQVQAPFGTLRVTSFQQALKVSEPQSRARVHTLTSALPEKLVEKSYLVGRLAIAPDGPPVFLLRHLLRFALGEGLHLDWKVLIADCSPCLLKVYERLAGFMSTTVTFNDPVHGPKIVIAGHRARVTKSPLWLSEKSHTQPNKALSITWRGPDAI